MDCNWSLSLPVFSLPSYRDICSVFAGQDNNRLYSLEGLMDGGRGCARRHSSHWFFKSQDPSPQYYHCGPITITKCSTLEVLNLLYNHELPSKITRGTCGFVKRICFRQWVLAPCLCSPRALWYYRRGCRCLCVLFCDADFAGTHVAQAMLREGVPSFI